MDAKLDKPLEELIKQSKGAKKAQAQEGAGPGKSGRRGKAKAAGARAAPYQTGGRRIVSAGSAIRQPTPHQAVGGVSRPAALTTAKNRRGAVAGGAGGGTIGGTKLFVSNLDFGVTTQDIHDLFSEIGPLRAALVHFGEDNKSLGTAYVVYKNAVHATQAVEKYHSVPLDGRPLNVQMVAPASVVVGSTAAAASGSLGGPGRRGGGGGGGPPPRTVVTLGGGAPKGRGGGADDGGRGRGRGRKGGRGKGGGKPDEPVSMEALDADLDTYRQGMAAE